MLDIFFNVGIIELNENEIYFKAYSKDALEKRNLSDKPLAAGCIG